MVDAPGRVSRFPALPLSSRFQIESHVSRMLIEPIRCSDVWCQDLPSSRLQDFFRDVVFAVLRELLAPAVLE